MNIDDAIKHAEEVAERLEGKEGYAHTDKTCKECAEDHRQLAEWLKELKAYKAVHEESTLRLIDAEALKEGLGDTRDGDPVFRDTEFIRMDIVEEAIDNAPTIKTFTLADIEENYRKGLEKGLEEAEKHERKRPYRWLNRSSMTSHNEECGKCHFLFRETRQYYPYCPMCGTHLLPCYKTKER